MLSDGALLSPHVAWLRLKKCHLDDVESLKEELKGSILQYRLARGSVRGAISEMKRLENNAA